MECTVRSDGAAKVNFRSVDASGDPSTHPSELLICVDWRRNG